MSWFASLTPSDQVVWAWRLPRSQGISGAPFGRSPKSSAQGAGAGGRAGGGPSQVIEKPSAKYPVTSPHPERSEEHTSELQSHHDLVCRLLLEKKKKKKKKQNKKKHKQKKKTNKKNKKDKTNTIRH